ncbi:DUF308 domain-containing protein [Candidatus Saccharibacteria bacterium]|nr:DUF308 domain-containing protein [Candidatus Saccharibacteria bacterium]
MMNKTFFKITTDKIISGIALFCVGICLIIWAEQVTDAIAIVLGVLCLLYSVIGLVRFLKTPSKTRTTFSLFLVVLAFAAGLLLVAKTDFVKNAISFLVGFFVTLTSAISLVSVFEVRKKTDLKLGSFIWPIVGLLVGILCISGQFIVPDQLARLTGVVLVVYSVVYLAGLFTVASEIKALGKTAKIQEGEIVKDKTSKKSKSSRSSKSSSGSKSSKSSKSSKKSSK